MATRRKVSEVVNPKIIEVARNADVKLSVRNMNRKHTWNGKTIALLEADDTVRVDSNIIHDIAHYIIASKTRRKLPEFGLGSSPDIGPPGADVLLTYSNAQLEEEEASLLGILIMKALRLRFNQTFDGHMWNACDQSMSVLIRRFHAGKRNTTGLKALHRLLRKEHINTRLIPNVLL